MRYNINSVKSTHDATPQIDEMRFKVVNLQAEPSSEKTGFEDFAPAILRTGEWQRHIYGPSHIG